MNIVFPLCLFVVDIQGAHTLVGMFDSYSQVERPCISCDCTFDNLDDFRVQCNVIIHDDMHNAMINKSKDELKSTVSKNYLRIHFLMFQQVDGSMVY